MKLWVDDVRPSPLGEDDWTWAKSFGEAVRLFASQPGSVQMASLDHDLGYIDPSSWRKGIVFAPGHTEGYDWDAPTGYDLVKWIWANNTWPKVSLAIHTANPVGARNMSAIIERYGPYSRRHKYVVVCNELHIAHGVKYTRESE